MISGQKTKNSQYGTLNYYKTNKSQHIRAHQYEEKNSQKEAVTFRKKRTSDCQDLMYSSCLNPFARNKNMRFDQQYKDTFERKKKVTQVSNAPTDPVTLQYEPPKNIPRVRAPFQSSSILQMESDRKNFLPSQR